MAGELMQLAEARIQEALEAGLDRGLAGSGQPIDLDGYFAAPPSLRAGFGFLKSAGILPPEVACLREVERLQELLAAATNEAQVAQLRAELRLRQAEADMALERMRRVRKADTD